jgi:hypothetical protein
VYGLFFFHRKSSFATVATAAAKAKGVKGSTLEYGLIPMDYR